MIVVVMVDVTSLMVFALVISDFKELIVLKQFQNHALKIVTVMEFVIKYMEHVLVIKDLMMHKIVNLVLIQMQVVHITNQMLVKTMFLICLQDVKNFVVLKA